MAQATSRPSTSRLGRTTRFALGAITIVVMATLGLSAAGAGAALRPQEADASKLVAHTDGALFGAAETKQREVFEFFAALDKAREREAMWDRMAQCETGGNWQDPGRWAGGLGIAVSTWLAVGGDDFAPRPDQATREEQIIVAERIADRFGIHAWGCADEIGF